MCGRVQKGVVAMQHGAASSADVFGHPRHARREMECRDRRSGVGKIKDQSVHSDRCSPLITPISKRPQRRMNTDVNTDVNTARRRAREDY